MAVGSGWRLAVGLRWRLAAVGGWRWWRLAVGGGWWLAVDGPLWRSLRAVLDKKNNLSPKGPPCLQKRYTLQFRERLRQTWLREHTAYHNALSVCGNEMRCHKARHGQAGVEAPCHNRQGLTVGSTIGADTLCHNDSKTTHFHLLGGGGGYPSHLEADTIGCSVPQACALDLNSHPCGPCSTMPKDTPPRPSIFHKVLHNDAFPNQRCIPKPVLSLWKGSWRRDGSDWSGRDHHNDGVGRQPWLVVPGSMTA